LIVAGQQGEAGLAGQWSHGGEVLVVQRQDPGCLVPGRLHNNRRVLAGPAMAAGPVLILTPGFGSPSDGVVYFVDSGGTVYALSR
jgi:hypothetical protein